MDRKDDFQQAALWAHELLKRQDWVILDTETTGLGSEDQICQIAAIDSQGNTVIDTLVKPTIAISSQASAIHKITDEMVENAPSFPEVFMQLWEAIGDRGLVIYNAPFDTRMIQQSLHTWGYIWRIGGGEMMVIPGARLWCYAWMNGAAIHCAMHWFSQWCGEWNDYHGSYRWQRLPGGDHTALGDCKATLEIIRRMAASYEPEKREGVAIEFRRQQ